MDTTPTSNLTATANMHTEADFVKQAELAKSALQQFTAVMGFENADETKHSALNKVMKTIVCHFHVIFMFFT